MRKGLPLLKVKALERRIEAGLISHNSTLFLAFGVAKRN